MKRFAGSAMCSVLLLSVTTLAVGDDDRAAQQAKLDQACQTAREKKLAPERENYVQQCVANKERPDEASCERFYADYGNQSGNRAPLYMDLPECVKAFKFQQEEE